MAVKRLALITREIFFRNQLRRNMISGVLSTVLNTIVSLIAYPIYLHYLGYNTVGIWILLTTITSIAQLCSLGIGPAVTKLVAEDHGQGNMTGVQAYLMTAIVLITAAGGAAFLFILVFARLIVGVVGLHGGDAATALTFLPLMGALTVYVFQIQVLSAGLSGLGRMDQTNYRDALCRVVALLTAVGFLSRGFGIGGLFAGAVTSNVLMHVMTIFLLHRIYPFSFRDLRNIDIGRCRRMLTFGSGVLGSSVLTLLLNPLNKLLISRYVNIGAVPIYEMANVATMQIRNVIESAVRAVVPEVSRLCAAQGPQNIRRVEAIYTKSVRIVWIVGTPLFLFFLVFAHPILRLWLRDSFTESIVSTFQIMLLGAYFSLLCVPAYYILMGCHGITHCFLSTVVQVAVNVSAALLMIFVLDHAAVQALAICLALANAATAAYLIVQMRRCVTMRLFSKCETA